MKMNLICIGLILGFAVTGFGQDKSSTTTGESNRAERSIALNSATKVEGQLQSAVDVKKSKVGDEVILRTTKSIKQDGEVVVPKGSRLIGRITEVQEKSKSNGSSKLGMVFDRLENKEMSTPITASIISITSAASSTRLGDSASSDIFGSSSTSARTSGGNSSGGGLLGGAVGGVTSTTGAVLNTSTNAVGSVTSSAGQTLGSTTGVVGRTVNGIQISNAIDGSLQSESTLSAANKNIKLEKGVTLQLLLNGSVHEQ